MSQELEPKIVCRSLGVPEDCVSAVVRNLSVPEHAFSRIKCARKLFFRVTENNPRNRSNTEIEQGFLVNFSASIFYRTLQNFKKISSNMAKK